MCQQGATPRSPVPSTEIGRTHTAHAVGSPRGGLAGAEQIPASPRRQPCGSIPATTPSCPLRFLQGKVPPSHIADGDLSLYRTANDTFPLRICPARSVAIACCVHRRNSDGEALRENPHSSRCVSYPSNATPRGELKEIGRTRTAHAVGSPTGGGASRYAIRLRHLRSSLRSIPPCLRLLAPLTGPPPAT
jgi:hypothetical protein